MTAFRTCHTCAKPSATCPTREALQAAISGLRLTSVKHRCADYVAAFLAGEAVKVRTVASYHRDDLDDVRSPPRCWFPGHFIRLSGTRAIVRVAKGAAALDMDGVEFEPNGGGYLKVPLSRVAVRDGEPANVEACRWCAAILGVGDACGRDPHYTPARDCLAEAKRQALERASASAAANPTDSALEGKAP